MSADLEVSKKQKSIEVGPPISRIKLVQGPLLLEEMSEIRQGPYDVFVLPRDKQRSDALFFRYPVAYGRAHTQRGSGEVAPTFRVSACPWASRSKREALSFLLESREWVYRYPQTSNGFLEGLELF